MGNPAICKYFRMGMKQNNTSLSLSFSHRFIVLCHPLNESLKCQEEGRRVGTTTVLHHKLLRNQREGGGEGGGEGGREGGERKSNSGHVKYSKGSKQLLQQLVLQAIPFAKTNNTLFLKVMPSVRLFQEYTLVRTL